MENENNKRTSIRTTSAIWTSQRNCGNIKRHNSLLKFILEGKVEERVWEIERDVDVMIKYHQDEEATLCTKDSTWW